MGSPDGPVVALETEKLSKMNLSSGYDASNQGERQRRRYLGHTSYPAPPASPGSVGPQSLPMPGGYRYPPSPTHFVYPPMMAYQQHNGQHVAPRQLPPYVSGPLPQTSRSPGGPQSSNPAQKASGWGGVPFATSDDDAVVPKGPSGDGSQRPAAGSGAPSATGKSDAVASEGEGEQAAVDGGVEVSSSGRSGSRGGGARRRRDSTPCAFFLKTGSCAYGDRCKFDHPYDQAPKVMFNSLGLPLRPGEAPCAFFLKNLRCAFGHTCKYNHPEPTGQQAPSMGPPPMVYPMPTAVPHMQYMPMQYPPMQGSMPSLQQHVAAMGYYASPSNVTAQGQWYQQAPGMAAERAAGPPSGSRSSQGSQRTSGGRPGDVGPPREQRAPRQVPGSEGGNAHAASEFSGEGNQKPIMVLNSRGDKNKS